MGLGQNFFDLVWVSQLMVWIISPKKSQIFKFFSSSLVKKYYREGFCSGLFPNNSPPRSGSQKLLFLQIENSESCGKNVNSSNDGSPNVGLPNVSSPNEKDAECWRFPVG